VITIKVFNMIVQEQFLKKLRAIFDLNIYEVKVWAALLSRGSASAGELADISGVPRSRSYDVLESLEKKSFVVMKLGKPIKYLAIQPEEIVKRSKRKVEDRAKEDVENLDKVKGTELFNELNLLYKQGIDKVDPTEMAGMLKGRKGIYDHMKSVIADAKESLTIVTTSEGLARKSESLRSALKKASARGVKIRIAASSLPKSGLPVELKDIAEVKSLEQATNARFMIADSKDVVFMISNDADVHENYDMAIWVSTPFFATALEKMFNLSWNSLK